MSTSMFVHEIEFFLGKTGMGTARFGRSVMNDPAFVEDVRQGRSVGRDRMMRVRGWMRQNLPADVAWPKFEPTPEEFAKAEKVVPPEVGPAAIGSAALHRATVLAFAVIAERESIPFEHAGVLALYGREAFERWQAVAA